jgi:YD repeat-containing protein
VIASPLQILTTTLNDATAGAAYTATLAASGGSGTGYRWSLAAGSLPPGFSLDEATGTISSNGSPVAPAVTYALTVKVTDSSGAFTQGFLNFHVNPGAVTNGKKLGGCTSCQCADRCGEPISIGDGNMYDEVTDYATATANRLEFARYYNSLTAGSGTPTILGGGWRSTYDRYLSIAATSVAAERADGRVLMFSLNGDAWTTDSDVDARLARNGMTWTLTDSDDSVETYAQITPNLAHVTSIKSRNGYLQSLQYDASNQITAVTDSLGRSLGFTIESGLLQTLTTPDAQTFTYGYTSSGLTPGVPDRLASVTYSTTPATNQTYLYENAALPFGLTAIVDENGNRFTSWTYDLHGRALSSQHAGGVDLTTVSYNDTDGSRTVTEALGVQSVYRFSVLQNVPKLVRIDRLATPDSPAAARIFTYDANGYTASETDWNGNLTTYINDAHGQPINITRASGTPEAQTTEISYNPTFHLPAAILEPHLSTNFTYDSEGNLLTKILTDRTGQPNAGPRTWTYTWAGGLLASMKGPRTDVSQLTRFAYDASGTLVSTTNALGQTTRVTSHTGGGLPLTIVDANGVSTQMTYDARLRVLTATLNTAAGALTTSNTWDAAGNLVSVTRPDGSKLTSAYDPAHRLTGITDLLGDKISYTLDALGNRTATLFTDAANTLARTHSAAFDALGRMVQDTAGAGQVTTHAYDNNGNQTSLTDPLNRVTTRSFDTLNRLFQVVDPAGGVTTSRFDSRGVLYAITLPNDAVTEFQSDGFGQTHTTVSNDTGVTHDTYDLAGNLVEKADAAGAIIKYAYDALDRPLTITYPSDPAENVTFAYDEPGHGSGIGRLTSVIDSAGTLSRSYDERGNIISEVRVRSAATLLTSYSFDGADRLAAITYPSGLVVNYTRDSMGQVSGVSATPKNAAAPSPILTGIAYEPFGPAKGFTFGNGIAATRGYDLDYRLTSLIDGSALNLSYGYNAADDVLSIADSLQPSNSQSFDYDQLDRSIA